MRLKPTETGWPILFISAACSTLLIAACDRSPPALRQTISADHAPPLSLRETYDRLREWHANRSYLAMRPYIDSRSRDEVIDLLIAIDELFVANAAAQHAIAKACPGIPARRFDLAGQIADNLELFSKHVEFVSQQESGNRGTVMVQIAGRVPLAHVNFQRRDGYWVYVPGPVGPDLIPMIRAMADALNRIALVVSNEPRTRGEIEAEYRLRIGPKLRRIGQLAAAEESEK